MWQLVLFAYFIILGCLVKSGSIYNIIFGIVLGIIILACVPVVIEMKRKKIRDKIQDINNLEAPVININKAPWYIFDELPGFNRVSAKKAVWLRNKNQGYSSLEVFYELNNIDEKNKQLLNKIIFI